MKEVLTRWYRRYLSEEEAVILLAMLTMAFAVMLFFGDILAPVLVAIVLAYLMQGVANVLRQRGLPGELSVAVSTLLFLGGFFAVLFGLAPLVWRQLVALVREAPAMIEAGRKVLVTLPEKYPVFFTQQQVADAGGELIPGLGQSFAQAPEKALFVCRGVIVAGHPYWAPKEGGMECVSVVL